MSTDINSNQSSIVNRYRPEIDGLGAFAVVTVMINHFNKEIPTCHLVILSSCHLVILSSCHLAHYQSKATINEVVYECIQNIQYFILHS